MARRSGQNGYIEHPKNSNWFYVRFWEDVRGQEKRKLRCVKLCPAFGPGKLTKSERVRKSRDVIQQSGVNSPERFENVQAVNRATVEETKQAVSEKDTFEHQASVWLDRVEKRKRKPVKPSTLQNWQYLLDKWIIPELGDLHLADVNNLALKGLVEKLVQAGLSAKSVHNLIQIPKMVMASAVNDEGEELYPRKWNVEFLDLPSVDEQHQPTFASDVVSQIVTTAKGQCRMLYALVAGTGMRAGEAFGLMVEHVSADCSVIAIKQSVWGNQVQSPKTKNAIREIDLHSSLAKMLRQFIGDRKSGFLFQNRAGKVLCQTNTLRRSLHPILREIGAVKAGFHAFRRFRTTHLRKSRAPEDLIRFWLGHSNTSITDAYSKVSQDVDYRGESAEKAGLGFEIPSSISVVDTKSSIDTKSAEKMAA